MPGSLPRSKSLTVQSRRPPVLLDYNGNVLRFSTRPGVETLIEREGNTTRVWNTYAIPQSFLDRLKAERNNAPTRAPLGDRNSGMQKIAEVPLEWLLDKIGGAKNWEDLERQARLLNDSDYSDFRTDAPGRRF